MRRPPAPRAPALVLGLVLGLVVLVGATAGRAQSVGGAWIPPASQSRSAPLPHPPPLPHFPTLPLMAALAATAPLHTLPPASTGAADQLAALAAWNAAGRLPRKSGFTRVLTSPAEVRLGGSVASAAPRPFAGGLLAGAGAGEVAWGTRVTVQDAYRLRLHLSNVRLPPGTSMWVAARSGAPRQFGLELLAPGGDLWTPSVAGDSLLFEVHVPAGASAGFTVREVMEIVDLRRAAGAGAPAGDPSCIVDSSCSAAGAALPGLDAYRHAVAQLSIATPEGELSCSGGLLNDLQGDGVPYLLTANHCFSDQAAASSLEAVFDDYTSSCNGAPPGEGMLPTANGAQLLATGTTSDFTFVRLDNVPPGRFFLGWTADASAVMQDTRLFRLSFPFPESQANPDPERFSESLFQTGDDIPVCDNLPPPAVSKPRPDFLYATLIQGGTFGGSSGAPLLLGDGRVVGQLGGGCAVSPHNASNGCDYANSEYDGAFNVTYPSIARWLNPLITTGPCVPNATTLCLDRNPGDRRFRVQVSYATSQGGGQAGAGNAVPLANLGITAGGLFWFFGAANPEMLIKIVDGCALNSKLWVFYAATTNVGFTVTVTDTVALDHATYVNPDQQAALPVEDTSALTCP